MMHAHFDDRGLMHVAPYPALCDLCKQRYKYDPTPDPDAAKVRVALAVEDVQRAIDNVTLAIKDDPRLDEALDIYRERLRGIRAALESEARP